MPQSEGRCKALWYTENASLQLPKLSQSLMSWNQRPYLEANHYLSGASRGPHAVLQCHNAARSCVTPCARHIQIPPSPCIPMSWQPSSSICHPPHAILHPNICTRTLSSSACMCARVQACIMAPPLLHRRSTLLYPPLTPSVSFWHTSHIHVIQHAPHFEMCTVSAPTCTPTEFSLLSVEYCEIHCAVMLHSTSYHCLPRSNCKFHFNSMHPNMLAYLLSPVIQNHHSISAHHSLCLCSI